MAKRIGYGHVLNAVFLTDFFVEVIKRCKLCGYFSRGWSVKGENREYQSPFPGSNATLSIGSETLLMNETEDGKIIVRRQFFEGADQSVNAFYLEVTTYLGENDLIAPG